MKDARDRGLRAHEVAHDIEVCMARLRRMGVGDRDAERLAAYFTLRLRGSTHEEAWEASRQITGGREGLDHG